MKRFLVVLVIAMLFVGCIGGGKNIPPKIDSTIPAEKNLEVEIDESIDFSITASDLDGDNLEYVWEQTGDGSFTEKDGAKATWKAPAEAGEATVKVTVGDGKDGTVSHSWNITVVAGEEYYNEHDYQKLKEFLEQKDENGIRNGDKLSASYDPDDPESWGTEFIWTDNLEKRILSIEIGVHETVVGALDLSGCSALEELRCSLNQLISLDVSGLSSLTILMCWGNELTSLGVSGCSALEELSCSQNQLTSLDVSGCSALVELWCGFNQLTSLDVSGFSALKALGCNNSQLTSLDVSGCSALELLWCAQNQLVTLDVSDCSALEDLNCDSGVTVIGWPK